VIDEDLQSITNTLSIIEDSVDKIKSMSESIQKLEDRFEILDKKISDQIKKLVDDRLDSHKNNGKIKQMPNLDQIEKLIAEKIDSIESRLDQVLNNDQLLKRDQVEKMIDDKLGYIESRLDQVLNGDQLLKPDQVEKMIDDKLGSIGPIIEEVIEESIDELSISINRPVYKNELKTGKVNGSIKNLVTMNLLTNHLNEITDLPIQEVTFQSILNLIDIITEVFITLSSENEFQFADDSLLDQTDQPIIISSEFKQFVKKVIYLSQTKLQLLIDASNQDIITRGINLPNFLTQKFDEASLAINKATERNRYIKRNRYPIPIHLAKSFEAINKHFKTLIKYLE
jgi:hypothetical protein